MVDKREEGAAQPQDAEAEDAAPDALTHDAGRRAPPAASGQASAFTSQTQI